MLFLFMYLPYSYSYSSLPQIYKSAANNQNFFLLPGKETRASIPLIRTLPHYLFIYKFIHTTQWLDKDRFQISDKSGQVVFGVDVPEEKASMQLWPKTMGLAELVQEVGHELAKE